MAAPKKIDDELMREREEAWVGDAVLALFVRRLILKEQGKMDGEMFIRCTSNDFLRNIGNPTSVEALIGRIYEGEGLEAAFPIHSRRGLSVVQLNGEIPDVVDAVERVIEEKSHVKPRLYVATEAASVPYDYAPGIKNYRDQLEEALHGRETVQLDHAMLMRMLKDASKTYRVLVIKTRSALPYTSVFMEYW